MSPRFTRRGQPLIVLLLLLGGWVSARAVMWEPATAPLASPGEVLAAARIPDRSAGGGALRLNVSAEKAASIAAAQVAEPDGLAQDFAGDSHILAFGPQVADDRAAEWETLAPAVAGPTPIVMPPHQPGPIAPASPPMLPVPPRIAGGHQLLWMAALAHVPMPAALLGAAMPAASALPGAMPRQAADRWSVDSWALWRRGSKLAPSGGLLTPSYGASQLGAVLRYRLAPDSALRPAVYLRTTAALNGSGEREAALGLALRPIARLPLSLNGEARLTSTPRGSHLRPAAFVVTELAPFALPLGLRGEIYGQAGYVGGKFATGFADGQLRLDRTLVRLGQAEMRLGGGVWGGIQKGASRVDAGPSLTFAQPLGGPASMRLAADWRFRVAGKAAPGSGPAITLSAGF